jgi:hypothetical protein
MKKSMKGVGIFILFVISIQMTAKIKSVQSRNKALTNVSNDFPTKKWPKHEKSIQIGHKVSQVKVLFLYYSLFSIQMTVKIKSVQGGKKALTNVSNDFPTKK